MSRLHVLNLTGSNTYRVIVHATTPVGNNSAGISWATALQNSGLAGSRMTIGTGPGQILQAEADQVTAGTVIEAPFYWQDNPAWDNTTRQNDLNARATEAVNNVLADYAARLKYFGFVVA